ncbi:MAG: serine/threonine protein kinase, partial [Verrucomicrobia subdivision 3 bacterium]|nr:serine/threonine protein kinase [Limisphaerales bacterium]
NNVKMFIHEARLIARLQHPNIVRIFDFGETEETYYIVMEYVDGLSLTDLLQRSAISQIPLPLPIGVYIISEILEGLQHAHTANDADGQPLHLVHRDLSPDNILLSREGEVKLSDFGIAKSRIQEHQTQTGMTKGKILYMSPEQCYGRELDHRSDIFSMGNLLFEVCTLERLFMSKDIASVAMAICHGPIKSPSSIRAGFPIELEAIILKALERPLESRFQSAKEMVRAIKQFMQSHEYYVSRDDIKAFIELLLFEGTIAEQHIASLDLPHSGPMNAPLPSVSQNIRIQTPPRPVNYIPLTPLPFHVRLRPSNPPPAQTSPPPRALYLALLCMFLVTFSGFTVLWLLLLV